MINQQNSAPLIVEVQQYIQAHPNRLIGSLVYNGQLIWIKRRPFSKKTIWHKLQHYVARGLRLPILSPTVTHGGAGSLSEEAERLNLFAIKNIPVPKVLAVTEQFIVTENVGYQLHRYLKELADPREIQQLLQSAAQALNQLHLAGLCHARPSLRDMTISKGDIFFIDLEENPLSVMSLFQAQARDIWLFLNSAARFCSNDPSLLAHLFATCKQDLPKDTLLALQKLVNVIKPLRFLAEHICKPVLGRDGLRAITANKVLEQTLR